jgi:UDP-glucose 4-epimerase
MNGRCIIRCLVTGGAGFIGSHIVDTALRRGYAVRVLDNLSTGYIANLAGVMGDIEFIHGDIRDRTVLSRCMEGVDLVFHHAALASVPLTVEDPILSTEINDLGTMNVFRASCQAGCGRVVYASSSAVYGTRTETIHVESLPVYPDTPYAAHKRAGEYYAAIFKKLYGPDIVSLRYFNVYGPRQDPSSPYSGVISIFMDKLKRGERPTVYGDGGQSRDFIYIDDVVRVNFLAAEARGVGGKIFNVGTGKSVTLNEMLKILGRLTGKPARPVYEAPRPGDVYASCADIDRARIILGFEPEVTLQDGLRLTWKWFAGGKALC